MITVTGSTTDIALQSGRWVAVADLKGCPHQAYSEAAFRYFLALERKRAERSGRALLLLLVDLNADGEAISEGVSQTLFAGLGQCVRDVDFIGWYRHGRVAGAVLTQGSESPALEASEHIAARVSDLLRRQLPASTARSLTVRVIQARQRVEG